MIAGDRRAPRRLGRPWKLLGLAKIRRLGLSLTIRL
jgi:hypothetical protein